MDVDPTDFGFNPRCCTLERRAARAQHKPDLDVDLQDYGIDPASDDLIRHAASSGDRRSAIDSPTLGWSGFGRLYNSRRGRPLPDEAFRTSHLVDSDLTTRNTRVWGSDTASRALAAAETTKVEQKEWWMTKEDGSTCTPLGGLDFVAYRLKNRLARRHPNPHGQ